MHIACIISKCFNQLKVNIYDARTEKYDYLQFRDKSLQEIIKELITKFKGDIGKIVVDERDLESDELESFKEENLKKHGNLVHISTKKELDFEYYLSSEIKYSIGDLIILFRDPMTILYKCIAIAHSRVTWKEVNIVYRGFHEPDFQYIKKIYHREPNEFHAVFLDSQENVNSLYGCNLNNYNFKSVNFIKEIDCSEKTLIFARFLISDPKISVLVITNSIYKTNSSPKNYVIEDWGFIHIPKLIEEYESKRDIMGIDFGSTRCVLAVSVDREIEIVPIDSSSYANHWTESVISFDGTIPYIGKTAIRRLRTKPDCVVFDTKLLCNKYYRKKKSKQLLWPFSFNIKEDKQPDLELMTSQRLKKFSLADINKVFLEQMLKVATEYQDTFDDEKLAKKAVISIPKYFDIDGEYNIMISSIIEAAKLADIEIIDIIEETHADFLYYLSHKEYSKKIKPGMKITIFDIGGGTCISRVYEISEYEGKTYANCIKELSGEDNQFSGRDIDDIIIEELEKLFPEDLNKMKLRILEAAKEIKHDLSFKERINFNLSEIYPQLNKIVEFTREWFEQKLETYFSSNRVCYTTYKHHQLPTERKLRCKQEKGCETYSPLNDVDIVFLAGGTCRIPFILKEIQKQFPKAEIIPDEESIIYEKLETITATGAAIHALQVVSGEIKPYIKFIEHESGKLGLSSGKSDKEIDNQNRGSEDKLNTDKNPMNKHHESKTQSHNKEVMNNNSLRKILSEKNLDSLKTEISIKLVDKNHKRHIHKRKSLQLHSEILCKV